MRKIFTLFSLVLIGKIATAQQDAALAPPSGTFTSPVSGCALTATENVTVRIFNFGPGTIVTPFNVSYTINGGTPVTELVPAPNIPQNTSFTYTFSTQANLSTPGTYTFDATVTVPGDPTSGNNTYTGYVVNALSPSVGGTIAAPSSVCISSNSGILTLGGQTGNVLGWEYSTDGGGTWIGISNTSTSQTYNNLTVPTRYRAQVQNSSCTPVYSAEAIIAIDPVTVGGTVAGGTTVCTGANSGNLTSGGGRVGTILKWQYSTDGGATWNDTAVTTTTLGYLNLTATRLYRVQVQSGACATAFSSAATVTVNPASVGGTTSPATTTVCSGANGGTITLAGHTGTIIRWEFSIDGGATWTNVTNATTSLTYTNLTTSTQYRVRIQSNPCTAVYSSIADVTVVASSIGGTVTANATVCSGTNSGTLTLAGNAGAVQFWQFSTNGGASYTNIANTTNTLTYTNLTTTTLYRANVRNGSCTAVNSSVATITVNPVSEGGTTAPNATVCSGSNSGTITLSGQTGSITNWLSSNDGVTWNTLANTTTTQTYTNLTATTYYMAVVKSGVCNSDSSSVDTITVNQPTVGGTVNSSANICYGNNTGTLTLTGETGSVLRWESSIDGGINWVAIANTTTSHVYANLVLTTQYRAVVQNGNCSVVNSTPAILTIDPVSVGGTVTGSATACGGSNNGSLDLIDYVGTILNWESSTDGGATWTMIANTTATENYTNVLSTTLYRAIVKSGSCSQDTSSIATISVDPPTVGGVLTMDDTVCASVNGDTLMLSGHTGSIVHWESSTDGGNTWVTLANTSTSQIYTNLTTTTSYRVLVKSGVCNPMTSNTITITVDPIAVGGMLNGSVTVCDTINSGTLSLSGSTGAVQNWESSVDGGFTWSSISNTTTSLMYTNLQDTTWYRVIVASGLCGMDTSSTAVIFVNPATVAGALSSDDTVCVTGSGVLHLTGYTGNITGWEVSTDGGFNWTPVSNTTDSLTYNNLTVTTSYHAIVKSGICNSMTSNIVTITVDPIAVGGTLNGTTTVCDTINSGTLTLTGSSGAIQNWESSVDGGATWSAIANTTTSLIYTNLQDTTWYRVIIMSGACGGDTSSTAVIYVNPPTIAGTLSMDDTVCSGVNNGVLHLAGYTGMIIGWEVSTDGGFNWTAVTNTTDSLTYNNLSVNTMYHAIVKSGICNAMTSNNVTITVNPVSASGTISGSTPGCEGANSGTLMVTGYVGSIVNWESSIDGGLTWAAIGNTTASQTYSNLTDTTWYHVIVQSGVCSSDTSAATTVIVYPKPVAMFSTDTVCFGSATTFTNSSTITSGSIQFNQWDFGDGNNSLALNPVHTYDAAGSYIVSLVLTSNLGCGDTTTQVVNVNALPSNVITASGPLTFCSGDSVTLSAATGTYTYMWSTSDTTQSITVMTSGTYVVIVTDSITGCSSNNMEVVTVLSPPVSPATGLNSTTVPNPLAGPAETTTYQLVGTDVNGCTDKDSVMITVIADFNVTISNIMTPNEDGYNDRFIIQNLENYPNTKVTIVNRSGTVVFTSDNYDNNWNGGVQKGTDSYGNTVADGTYYYFIEFEGSDKVYKG
ncbi:MAG: Ig-like protein, partial [Bacteroidetes bacterium]|nr:Ig-like protein [Bacteroidota bacterium]